MVLAPIPQHTGFIRKFGQLKHLTNQKINHEVRRFHRLLPPHHLSEKATFTLYSEGDTRGSPHCAMTTNACGQPNQSGISAALSQAQYSLAAGQGVSPECGTCWEITVTSDMSGNPIKEKTIKVTLNNLCPIDGNSICNTSNKYEAGIHFDLCMDIGAESFLTFGARIGTARQALLGIGEMAEIQYVAFILLLSWTDIDG
ncbi:hypothetical protein F9C07_2111199 [Aspergillus flavus]|uniref:Expansin-like EG45 domain-containing protein n=1 Tax=Aspergillus flavus (strain ATCC 200026 / FGSC A1120 / IAM 13836 / NRRL 3357 / JCM 12722 / SRRC 167) TaxID=332952 RepID=A0A7G5KJ46_ASPFN|nr:uncharacterized protein G4B84_011355 [Aspergillus flavus NRRL3357]KAJ1713383.1 hypothetical protein NYO67_4471 [Aspergillus flavus]GMF81876.1 unnamed protein product [Aspergillus oryzae]KAF7629440.1 hypothetical protein AFLA_013156 [Aspergillus flavus NRRL3357]QMW35826.1 hypothetical protein G4B84_011355 [Aspergillus flavus NRRL3357]QMW47888.1 hypothetical protein G4B11_011406 [Aspergillus flavus]